MSLYPDSETGEVIQVLPGGKARVKIPKRSNCQGCGQRSFCDPFGSEHMVLESENSLLAGPGARVQVSFDPERQGKAIVILYLIPLVALMLGAFIGNSLDPFANKDLSASIFCLAFTGLSFFGIRIYTKKKGAKNPSSRPRIVQILS